MLFRSKATLDLTRGLKIIASRLISLLLVGMSALRNSLIGYMKSKNFLRWTCRMKKELSWLLIGLKEELLLSGTTCRLNAKGKARVKIWKKMRKLLKDRFLPSDYQQYLF